MCFSTTHPPEDRTLHMCTGLDGLHACGLERCGDCMLAVDLSLLPIRDWQSGKPSRGSRRPGAVACGGGGWGGCIVP